VTVPHPALTDSLRRKAEDDTERVWQEARAEAEKCRGEATRAVATQQAEAEAAIAAATREFTHAAVVEAEREARKIRMAMTTALADRLHTLARAALPQFRDGSYGELFAALATELPSRQWQRVTINPADQSLAQVCFPQAQVVCDPHIDGGMDVAAEEDRIRISNTLETRLEAAWPDLLPDLMRTIFQECDDSHAST